MAWAALTSQLTVLALGLHAPLPGPMQELVSPSTLSQPSASPAGAQGNAPSSPHEPLSLQPPSPERF